LGLAILAGIGGALLVLLLLLAVPVHVSFRCEGIETPNAKLAIRGLFGLLCFSVERPTAQPAPGPRKLVRPRAGAQVKQRWSGPGRLDLPAVFGQTAFRRRMLRLARDLLAAAHLRQLRLQMRLGLGDPADTGRLWAVMGLVSAWARTLRDAQVQIEPEFGDALLEFQAEGQARLVPLRLLILLLVFALSPASLRAWRTLKRRDG
jgi:hypothetical protein